MHAITLTILLFVCQLVDAHPGGYDKFGCHIESKSGKRHCRHGRKASSHVNFINAEWVKNYDGDTITVNLPNVHRFFGKEIDVSDLPPFYSSTTRLDPLC